MTFLPQTRDNNTAALPLVLRRERNGGILFDPLDGTHVEVDAEGFAVLQSWLTEGQPPRTDEERTFLESIRQELPQLQPGSRAIRASNVAALDLPVYAHASVLSAPTLVDLQITRRCPMGCPQCYAGSQPDGEHVPYEDVVNILDQLADIGVCQLAIGGGEPLEHPRIVDVLQQAHARGIVPNVTTTGLKMTGEVLDAFARYCGAVALSLEGVGEQFARTRKSGFAFFRAALNKLLGHGIRTVLQVTVSTENLPSFPSIVDFCMECGDLYGVIFLAYKPAGRGIGFDHPLKDIPPQQLFPVLREGFTRLSARMRVGYDCCLAPGIMAIEAEYGPGAHNIVDGCSAARSSVGIATNLDVVPCTFLTHRPLGNLRTASFRDIWQSRAAVEFRQELDRQGDDEPACRSCPSRKACLGGSPQWDLVQCSRPLIAST